jgi:hypothetical protein
MSRSSREIAGRCQGDGRFHWCQLKVCLQLLHSLDQLNTHSATGNLITTCCHQKACIEDAIVKSNRKHLIVV